MTVTVPASRLTPAGPPRLGRHTPIERMNRTLMQRLKGLPGATGNSPKGRKARKPENFACLTLLEFERWLALEVAQRYHHSEHRGLHGATPHAAWTTLCETRPPRQLPPGPEEAWRLLINFMPLASRSVQADGLTIFYIRYWHPVFVVWREERRRVRVRYHPEAKSVGDGRPSLARRVRIERSLQASNRPNGKTAIPRRTLFDPTWPT